MDQFAVFCQALGNYVQIRLASVDTAAVEGFDTLIATVIVSVSNSHSFIELILLNLSQQALNEWLEEKIFHARSEISNQAGRSSDDSSSSSH